MFALCDMRSYYASVEAVFQPHLREKNLIAVCSLNDGAIISLTEAAKAVGVKKFEPYFKQKELCEKNGVEVFSSNFRLYGEVSRRIMDTLAQEVPRFECYSIDEGFCDFTGIPNPKEFAQHLRSRIWREQRIQMGVSIGRSKTIVKLGQNATKSIKSINGVCYLEHENQVIWLAKRTPVKDVWGVGSQLSKKLNEINVFTAYDLMQIKRSEAKRIGGVNLERTISELNGTPCHTLETSPPSRQQIIHSRSFGEKTNDINILRRAVSTFAAAATEKLRQQDSYAGHLSIWIGTSRFDKNPVALSGACNIPGGTNDSRKIIKAAGLLLDSIYIDNVKYAKAGVTLMDIRPRSMRQDDLLTDVNTNEDGAMKIMDDINLKFGKGTVILAAQGFGNEFAARKMRMSQNYLSDWKEIPIIKI